MFDGDKAEMQAFATNLRIVDNAPVNHRALADSLLRQAELMAEAVGSADNDDRGPWHKQVRMFAELAAVHAMLVDVPASDELDRLRELNSEQVAEVVELRREIGRLDTENAELRGSVSELERESARLRGERDLQEQRARVNLAAANKRIDAQSARISELESQLREVSRPNVSPVPPKAWTYASSTLPPQSINVLRSVDDDGPYLLRCQNNPTRWYWSTSGPEPRKDHRCGSWPNIVGQRPGLILVAYEPNREDDDD
jgi:hypothetical protein